MVKMFKRKADTQVTVYSASLRPDLRAAVRAISNGAYDKMQSQVFDLADGGAEGRTQEWLEAHRLPGASGWAVDRHSVIKADDDLHDKKTAASALCFFDALSYIAQYERSRLFVGYTPSTDSSTLPHYREVAAALGLPVDVNGEVHPAVGGRVLTDGLFNGTELAVAGKSLPVIVEPDKSIADYWPQLAAPGNELTSVKPTVPLALTQSWQGYRDEKAKIEGLRSDYNRADYLLAHIEKAIEQEKRRDFGLTSMAKAGNVFRKAGLICPFIAAVGIMEYWEHYKSSGSGKDVPSFFFFNGGHFLPRFREELLREIGRLPEGLPKSCLESFEKAAMPAFHFEKAIAIYTLCRENKIKAQYFALGLNEIEKAGTLAGLSEDKILQLRSDYQAGRLPEPGTFIMALEKSHRDFKQAVGQFERYSAQKLKALGGPVGARKA
jgi:hypothetical protein